MLGYSYSSKLCTPSLFGVSSNIWEETNSANIPQYTDSGFHTVMDGSLSKNMNRKDQKRVRAC